MASLRITSKKPKRKIFSRLKASKEYQIPDRITFNPVEKAFACSKGGPSDSPKVSLLAYTGGPMVPQGFDDPVIVNLEGVEFQSDQTPILLDHNPSLRFGYSSSQEIDLEKGEIRAEGPVLRKNGFAKSVVQDAREGFPFQVSMGAEIKAAYFVEEGESVFVNGETHEGPVIIADKTLLYEYSVLTFGADSKTKAAIAASRQPVGGTAMRFLDWIKANKSQLESFGYNVSNVDKISAADKKSLKALWKRAIEASGDEVPKEDIESDEEESADLDETETGETETETEDSELPENTQSGRGKRGMKSGKKPDAIQAHRNKLASEQRRVDSIQAIASDYRGELNTQYGENEIALPANIVAKYSSDGVSKKMTVSNLTAAAIQSGMTPDEFENVCMKAARPNKASFSRGSSMSGSDPGFQGRILSCAIQMTLGMESRQKSLNTGKDYGYETQYKEQELEAAHKLGAVTLHQLLDLTIKAATGFTFEGNRKSLEFLKAASAAATKLQAAGTFSTLSVSSILEDAANKMLVTMYEAQQVIWPYFTKEIPLSDFKVHNIYRLDNRSRYQKLGDTGEIKHGSFSDDKMTLQADTYAVMLALPRQMMINDDLSAFSMIPQSLGALSNVAIESAFAVMLLANAGSFFHADNKNLETGAGSDFGTAGLTLAAKKFRNLVDANGNPILMGCDRILVGSQDEHTAKQLYAASELVGSTTANVLLANTNVHVGKYKPYVSAYLSNTEILNQETGAAISGQDSDQWYMCGNPANRAAFHVGFLNGKKTPTLEMAEADFSVLGMQMRTWHDWALGQGDEKAMVKMAGA